LNCICGVHEKRKSEWCKWKMTRRQSFVVWFFTIYKYLRSHNEIWWDTSSLVRRIRSSQWCRRMSTGWCMAVHLIRNLRFRNLEKCEERWASRHMEASNLQLEETWLDHVSHLSNESLWHVVQEILYNTWLYSERHALCWDFFCAWAYKWIQTFRWCLSPLWSGRRSVWGSSRCCNDSLCPSIQRKEEGHGMHIWIQLYTKYHGTARQYRHFIWDTAKSPSENYTRYTSITNSSEASHMNDLGFILRSQWLLQKGGTVGQWFFISR
jgi:hypothetical protein